jgi:hypothetical protein
MPLVVTVPSIGLSQLMPRSCILPARKSPPRSNVMHRSRDVGHQNGPFSALHAPSISVSNLAAHDMINRDVIKCHHFREPAPILACQSIVKLS